MDWIKKHYDRLIVLIVALVTVALSVGLILKSFAFSENFALIDVTPRAELPENRLADVEAAINTLKIASVWDSAVVDSKSVRLFMTFPIVERDGEIFDMSENEKLLRPPVDNTWLVEHGLDFLREDVLDMDPEGDGFTNLEEWNAKTVPSDGASSPPILTKLYFVRPDQEQYVIEFSAKPDAATFQVARRLPNPVSGFFKQGDTFFEDDQRFTIENFEAASQEDPNSGIVRDVSRLTVRDSVTGEPIDLVYRQRMNLPTHFAIFDFTLEENDEFRVKEGEIFTLPGRAEQYKLIEVQEDGATISTVPAPGEPEETYPIKPPPAS
ncbi:MAG: Amuc_1099 family pilus-like system protein [Verrucomicrobiota bacterium]